MIILGTYVFWVSVKVCMRSFFSTYSFYHDIPFIQGINISYCFGSFEAFEAFVSMPPASRFDDLGRELIRRADMIQIGVLNCSKSVDTCLKAKSTQTIILGIRFSWIPVEVSMRSCLSSAFNHNVSSIQDISLSCNFDSFEAFKAFVSTPSVILFDDLGRELIQRAYMIQIRALTQSRY